MTATVDATRARRYLLGQASDEESAVIEQEYLADEEAIDLIASAEDDLIEDYLANNLDASERQRFEQGYLASPMHQVRVDTIRRLMAQGAQTATTPTPQTQISAPTPPKTLPFPSSPARRMTTTRQGSWLALAASLILVAAIAFLVVSQSGRQSVPQVAKQEEPPQQPAQPQQTPAPQSPAASPRTQSPAAVAPRVFALTVSPVSVRGASESRAVTIPADAEIVAIRLEREAAAGTLTPTRASIRTVAGAEVWKGAATADANAPRGTIARLDVPAGKLPTDDYLITLYGSTRAGAEREWAQYFLRVRAERTP